MCVFFFILTLKLKDVFFFVQINTFVSKRIARYDGKTKSPKFIKILENVKKQIFRFFILSPLVLREITKNLIIRQCPTGKQILYHFRSTIGK